MVFSYTVITHINSYFTGNKLHSELIKKLDSLGLKQSVFIPVQNHSDNGRNKPENLNNSELFYNQCFTKIDRYLWPLKMIKIWISFKKTYKHNIPKVIHAHTLIVNGLIAYWAYKKYKIPYVVSVRNTDINIFLKYIPFFKYLGSKILKHACSVVTVSPAYRDYHLAKYLSARSYLSLKNKCIVIPNGINDFWIQNRQKKTQIQKTRTVIFAGRIDKNKNLKHVISACELLNNKGFQIKLLVVGDGPLLSGFQKQRFSVDIQFAGHVSSREELLELYRNSDILVNPSFTETFGLVYPEAMSQGLPIIYPKNEGFDVFYPDGQVGFAVNPNNIEDIADKIFQIYNNYERISENAFVASKDFEWNKIAKKLLSIYESVQDEVKAKYD